MKPLLEKCAELHMPVSIHVAEDAWMYENADSTNDGLMNAGTWKVDMSKKGILDHDQLVATLENAVKNNPKTIFIACHLANCCSDLSKLARLFDTYPNLYADIAARYGEIAPIPRYVHDFMEKYSSRIVYGTDMGTSKKCTQQHFIFLRRLMNTFISGIFNYHWPLYGLSLTDETLKKFIVKMEKRSQSISENYRELAKSRVLGAENYLKHFFCNHFFNFFTFRGAYFDNNS